MPSIKFSPLRAKLTKHAKQAKQALAPSPWLLACGKPLASSLLVFAAATSQAHDWVSPRAAVAPLQQHLPKPAPGQGPWVGQLWAGLEAGRPAAPSARDCKRAPQQFEVPAFAPGQDPYRTGQERVRDAPYGLPSTFRRSAEATAAAPTAAPAVMPAALPAARPITSPATGAVPAVPAPALAAAPARAAADSSDRVSSAAPALQALPSGAHARPAHEPVTAGVVDDNADFGEYQAYRRRAGLFERRELDISQRVLLDVRDERGRPVPDALVQVYPQGAFEAEAEPTRNHWRDGRYGRGERLARLERTYGQAVHLELPVWARTDAHGRAWLMPQADALGSHFDVRISHGGRSTQVQWQRGQKDRLQARLAGSLRGEAQPARAQLDVVFLVDATGSMGDEIDKLKRSMRAVAEQVAALPAQPDLCFALVAYRDRGDEFFVRGADFTHDLGAFQSVLGKLRAGGGGDYPEALNEAFHTAVHRLSWRGEGTARLVVLVADAPPQLNYGGPQYQHDVRAANAKGIKVFSVGASGLNDQGEYIFRQLAQFTGGRFVFLTYDQAPNPASGPGRETVHDVSNYSVETLDKLLVRLVCEELADWPGV